MSFSISNLVRALLLLVAATINGSSTWAAQGTASVAEGIYASAPPRLYFAYSTILDRAAFDEWRLQHSYGDFVLPSGRLAEAADVDLVFDRSQGADPFDHVAQLTDFGIAQVGAD